MYLESNRDLKEYNTFGISCKAENLIKIYSVEDVAEVVEKQLSSLCIIGGGSNILLTQDLSGYVLKNEIKGIQILSENQNQIIVEVGAGEKWHNFVLWTLSQNLGGVENLSLIPGCVGAAPMQNIGAYGVEQEQVFYNLRAINIKDGTIKIFSKEECNFGYRESIFKNEYKSQFFITHVSYKLTKTNHKTQIQYGAIMEKLTAKNITQPTIHDISDVIIEIRKSKLPDPAYLGNAGSFFKNPVISKQFFDSLKKVYPHIPSYPLSDIETKVPAGWLIEHCGFKGKRQGNIGVHKDQALVLVNYGGGYGLEIKALADDICKSVYSQFNVQLSPEVNIW